VKHEEAFLRPVYGYRLNEELRPEIVSYCSLELAVFEALKKYGFEIESPKVVRGQSGMEHRFHVAAAKAGRTVMLELTPSLKEVGTQTVAEFFGKIHDAKPQRAMLVVMPRLSDEAQKLSTMYGLEVVTGDTPWQAVQRLLMAMDVDMREPPGVDFDAALRALRRTGIPT